MYEVNSLVIHRREGLCDIVDIKDINGKQYYLLKARRGDGENIYVPVDNANAIIRDIMSVESADRMLLYMKSLNDEIITNTKQRRDYFKKKLSSGSIHDIMYLAKQLYLYYGDVSEDGVSEDIKFGPLDIELLESAEDILFDELELTYNVPRDSLRDYIINRMNSL
ncbi:MAG: CarD family transcriptional regulator [Coprobacillus sp.]|nr:CarD family transcriptional regulator [Coprobacillus sp.]